MKSVTSVEYVPIRHVIRFIAYRMNWSIVRVAEWLLARDFEQYISAYKKGENSKYYEINNINDIEDIATEYLLKRTLDIGHSAICTEGTKETSKDFYKAYYKMKDINNNDVLNRLDLNFNEIHDFSFYDIDAKGYVRAINSKLLNITDEHIIPTPSVPPPKSDPYEQYLVELEQLKIDEARNNAKSERRQNEQLTDTYKEFFETAKDVINRLESTIEQQSQDINNLSKQLEEKADALEEDKELNPKDSAYYLIAIMKNLLLDPNTSPYHFKSSSSNSTNQPTQTGLAEYIDSMNNRGLKTRNINGMFSDANRLLNDSKKK